MNATPSRSGPSEVFEGHARFEHCRCERGNQLRIPKPRWEAAIALLPTYGLSRVSKALWLSHADLKRRRTAVTGSQVQAQPCPPSLSFVALPAQLPMEPSWEVARLELTEPSGAVLRLTLLDAGSLAPAAPVAVFFRRAL